MNVTEEQMEEAAAALARLTGQKGEDRTEVIKILKAMAHGGSYAADRARGQLSVLEGGYEVDPEGLHRWIAEWKESAEKARVGCQTHACTSCRKERLPRTRKLLRELAKDPRVLTEEQLEQALMDTKKGAEAAYLARGRLRAHEHALRTCLQRLAKVHVYKDAPKR